MSFSVEDQWGLGNTPIGPHTLRKAADRMEEIYKDIGGYEDSYLEPGDWRWGLRVRVIVEDTLVGEIRPHPDGFLGLYFDKETIE